MTRKQFRTLTGLLIVATLWFHHQQGHAQEAAPCARETGPQAHGLPSEDRIFGWIEEITHFGERRTGTPAIDQAAAYVKCKFESLGVQDVHYETATSWQWEATKHSLHVNGRLIDSFPVAFSFVKPEQASSFSTGPQGLRAPLMDVGSGQSLAWLSSQVKGKIVVFDLKFQVPIVAFAPAMEFIWDPQLTIVDKTSFTGNPYQTNLSSVVKRLMDAGAVGFVGVLADYFDSNKYHNEYYRRLQMTLPGVWITKTEGIMLRALMRAQGGKATAKLVLEGSRQAVPARAVMGVLPGRTNETIMVTSHHDSVWNGAVEDASGVASVFAQAQIAASKPWQERDKTLMFVTMDSHFTGYQVHQMLVDKYIKNPQSPYRIVGNVTLEHIGKQGVIEHGRLVMREQSELLGVLHSLSPSLSQTMKQSIRQHDVRRMALLNTSWLCGLGIGIPTDASFTCAAGVPTASLVSAPIYLYDQADTLDKVAKDKLRPVNKVFADLIEAMDKTPSDQMGR